ncbi:MAG: hypothetical protein AB1Z98_24265 [Nannocystaceae bacterium]
MTPHPIPPPTRDDAPQRSGPAPIERPTAAAPGRTHPRPRVPTFATDRGTDPRTLPASGPRDLDLAEVVRVLRALARLTPDRRSLGEWAATYRRDLPPTVPAVDVDAWIAWVVAGLPLFSGTVPTVKQAREAATRVLLVISLARAGGSLSAVARALDSSRKVLRDRMRRLGLYPWRAGDERGEVRADDRS